MKYVFTIACSFFLISVLAQSPYISRIVEYHPAPGQFINTAGWGTPAKANSLIGGVNGGISLGGFGGYIVVGFDHRIENDPDNPYGIDFTVFGNPLATGTFVTWSEAAAVMVMKDENGNGLPDDTWYELAGSDYHFKSTVKNYQITYTNPRQPAAADVPWADNQSQAGYILKNEFHLQPYYPLAISFPAINQDQIVFTGNKIKGYVDKANPSLIQSYKRGFGYADNALGGAGVHTLPDNPYTKTIEGAGGDAFDIDWAVDADGNYVYLDGIDFIKIYTALQEDAGWLGEVSSEIRGVVDVAPDASVAGVLDMVVLADLPMTVNVGTTLELEAYAFRKGILRPHEPILFSVSNEALAEVQGNQLFIRASGEVTITASWQHNPDINYSQTIRIVAPSAVSIQLASQNITVNSRHEISAVVKDQNGIELQGIEFFWRTSDPQILEITNQEERTFISGKSSGSAWLVVSATYMPDLKDSVLVHVFPEGDMRYVYLTIKDEEDVIFSRKRIAVKNFDLNPYLDNRQGNYNIAQVTGVTAAHAIAQLFANESFASDLRFRDDVRGDNKLYLWRVPKVIGSVLAYQYGYGGSAEVNFTRTWMVKVNDFTYANGLHEITISNNDELVVYQVADVTESWQLTHIRASKDTVEVGEPVTITVIQLDQQMNAGRTITTIASDAVANAAVQVNDQPYINASIPLRTDELGRASLHFYSHGVKHIQVAGTSIDVVVKADVVTGIEEWPEILVNVYPNPADQIINLETSYAGFTVYEVIDLKGRQIMNGTFTGNTHLDVGSLTPGVYVIRLSSPVAIKQVKVVKR